MIKIVVFFQVIVILLYFYFFAVGVSLIYMYCNFLYIDSRKYTPVKYFTIKVTTYKP